MSSTGSGNDQSLIEPPAPQMGTPDGASAGGRPVPLKLIFAGIGALVFAVFVGTQVIGVLVAIFFPPLPPLPGNLTVASHTVGDYGVDEWLYESPASACDIVRFYQDQQGVCSIAPLWCGDVRTDDPALSGVNTPGQHVARCQGEIRFSVFAMRWQAIISTADTPEYETEFRVAREIFWTGSVPPLPQN